MASTRNRRKGKTPYDTPNDEKRAYGRRLREAREVAGLSQAEAAQSLGYSQAVQLSLMESGQRMPPHAVLVACAKLYGTTMDFLCGLAPDSDRDPALGVQRHLAARISSDLQRLIEQITHNSVDVVRELLPGTSDGYRLATLAGEINAALIAFRERNPRFDDMRGGATLAAKIELASMLARQYVDHVDRGRRLMTVRALRDCRAAEAKTGQFNLLPALDVAIEGAAR